MFTKIAPDVGSNPASAVCIPCTGHTCLVIQEFRQLSEMPNAVRRNFDIFSQKTTDVIGIKCLRK